MEMQVELQATCSALGYQEGAEYVKESDCLETVKDLIKYLKREDDSCDIRRQLGGAQIVQNDLIPIIKQYKDERVLIETVLRLMVNLTQPAVLCFQNHIPEDKTNRNYYLEIVSQLQSYKEAFCDEGLFAVLTKLLGDLLQLDWENRQEEDRLLIERILIMIRNILHVPPNTAKEMRTDDDASVHDQLLWALHVSGMEDLLLYLASSDEERQFAFHVLEIISLIFREQTPDQLAKAGVSRSLSERQKEANELEIAREQEKIQKKTQAFKSTRHSRFGGTFTVANMKSISDRNVIYHRKLSDVKSMSFDHNKTKKRRAKNRTPITEKELTRRSTLSVRLFLKEFCIQFLENCYNPLMNAVKDTLVRSKAQENDETYYLWAMRFFMEFQRKHSFRIDYISETMSVQSFHYIQMNLINFHDMIEANKKEAVIWSKRLHLALKAYYELLETLQMMNKSKDKQLHESAKVIRGNIFYMIEYREILVTLLKKFDETRQSRSFLTDLIGATHLYTKMLESHCKGTGHVIVQKKKKNTKRKKKQQNTSAPAEPELTEQQLEDMWDEVSGSLSAIFQGREEVPEDVTPFDAASEVDVDQQRSDAMIKIQDALRGGKAGEAVALFRAAREVWPEREEFGSQDISAEDEFMGMREIFYANIPRPEPEGIQTHELEQEEEIEEEEIEEAYTEYSEQEFSFTDYIKSFLNQNIIKDYTLLLADYKKNSPNTNHFILRMLHRIGFDCKMPALLYQASLFRIFQKVMFDPLCKTKQFEELYQFAKYVVRSFFETAQNNDKVFIELFFWKSVRDAVEITEGYGTTIADSKKVKQIWTEEQDMELQSLFEQYKDVDEPEMDVADHILVHIIDQSKTRRQIVKQLIVLNLIGSGKDLKKKKGPSRGWREEEIFELRELLDRHLQSDDPLTNILNDMSNKRGRQTVANKILELGLISDKKELRKKTKGRKRSSKNDDDSDVSDREEPLPTWSSEDEAEATPPASESESEAKATSSEDEESDNEDPLIVKQIKKLTKKCIQKGLEAQIQWIQGCLESTAEDREADGDEEPIPIVTITEEQEQAMEKSIFKMLLKKIGLKPPANEQERFWRIPGKLRPFDLRSRIAALKVTPSDKSMTPSDNKEGNAKKSNDRYNALKALVKQKKTTATSDDKSRRKSRFRRNKIKDDETKENDQSDQMQNDISHKETSKTPPSSQKKKSRLKKMTVDSDSESDSDDERLVIDTNATNGPSSASNTPVKKSGKRLRLEESSEEEEESHTNEDVVAVKPTKKARIVESDESETEDKENVNSNKLNTFPATLYSMEKGDSDSDIEDHIPLSKSVKKKNVAAIESDSQ